MPNPAQPPEAMSPTKRALLALREAREEIAQLRAAQREPIAVVGLGCRFPGADDPDAFWRLLRAGEEAVGAVPAERWDADALYDPEPVAGKSYARRGAFLRQGGELDADFFGISPREMATLDPQQRLLLEVAWEALEDAGLPPRDRQTGRRTGVFVGIASGDFAAMLQARGLGAIDAYQATGTAHSVAAGRLSFLLGLEGPSLAVDTACSSSLVAVHLACESLRRGECDVALAAGVNRILTPDLSIAFCQNRMLSPTGRCHTFDAAADGFVRGEGCGVVALCRRSDARRQGDRILATIVGSAVGQDGRTAGLTVPNGPAQQAVIRDALRAADWPPDRVAYVEAHGTGTPLGDPIEVGALAEAYGSGPRRPLLIGSVKTNLGHLEAAAGIAGLIKTVLAIRHREIPPHLHHRQPNPRTPWERIPVEVVTAARPWPDAAQRTAGVSSFGFSGTNCHVLLAAPETATETATETGPPAERAADRAPAAPDASREGDWQLLTLSARSAPALAALVRALHDRLLPGPVAAVDGLCRDAARRRAHFEHRLAVLAADGPGLLAGLAAETPSEGDAAGSGAAAPTSTWRGRIGEPPAVAFLFTGQGVPVAAAGRTLFDREPVFRRVIEQCDGALADAAALADDEADGALATGALVQALYGGAPDPADGLLEPAALYAVEVALAALWRSWGIEPDAVAGHSLGEYAAAAVAGVMSIEDGVRLVAARARLMARGAEAGFMASVAASAADIERALADQGEGVAVAAWNGPRQVVLSGRQGAMEPALARLAAKGLRWQRLTTHHAFHSPAIEPILDDFEAAVAGVTLRPPRIDLIEGRTGAVAGDAVCTPRYWRRHAREPVRFADSVAALAALLDAAADPDSAVDGPGPEGRPPEQRGGGDVGRAGGCAWLEIGPRPVLLALTRRLLAVDAAPSAGGERASDATLFLPSLRPGRHDREQMLASLAQLYVRGADVRWPAVVGDGPRSAVSLPTYPWQRTPFPLRPDGGPPVAERTPAAGSPDESSSSVSDDAHAGHPLLGERLPALAARPREHVWQRTIADAAAIAFLDGHRFGGTPLVSFGTFLGMARSAARAVHGACEPLISDVVVHAPLFLSTDGVVLQSVLALEAAGGGRFEVHGRRLVGTADPGPAGRGPDREAAEGGPETGEPEGIDPEGSGPWQLHASMRIHVPAGESAHRGGEKLSAPAPTAAPGSARGGVA